MQSVPDFTVRYADWLIDGPLLRSIREQVFIREQGVPAELELDAADAVSRHVIALVRGQGIGTGRLLPDAHIGRMAVIPAWRGKGVGSALLESLIEIARSLGMRQVILNAQLHALPFYQRHGFRPEGEEFLDAGNAHRRMRRNL
jgi:predicted GNAT family N-acyltransferase